MNAVMVPATVIHCFVMSLNLKKLSGLVSLSFVAEDDAQA
jgi:hypothetical protein